MATVKMDLTCGCFNRSDYEPEQTFDSAEEARARAEEMIDDMNNNFCGRHTFSIDASDPENLVITFENTF